MASKMGVFSKMVPTTNDTTKLSNFNGEDIDDDIIIMNNGIKLDISPAPSSPIMHNHDLDESHENSHDNANNYLKFEPIDDHEPGRTISHTHNNIHDDDSNEIILNSARTNENTNYSDEIILASSNSIDLDENYYDTNTNNSMDNCKTNQKSIIQAGIQNSRLNNENQHSQNFTIDSNNGSKSKRPKIKKNIKLNSNHVKLKFKSSIQPAMISNQLFTQSQSGIAKLKLQKMDTDKFLNKRKTYHFKNLSNGE